MYCQVAEEAEVWKVSAMDQRTNLYAGHRYPIEIIGYAVWL
jgi:hypothetical protein